jgi:hypothetical protein
LTREFLLLIVRVKKVDLSYPDHHLADIYGFLHGG